MSGLVTAVAVTGAVSAYSQNKNAKKAAAAQQAGVEQAQQYSEEAAREASGMLNPQAQLYAQNLPALQQAINRGQTAGTQYDQTIQQRLGQGTAATQGINQMASQLGTGTGALAAQQGNLNVNQFLDPSMQFQLQQGREAIESSAAARGGLLSGATLKELTKFGTGLASTNYNNAVQQALANRAQQIGIGQTQAGIGQAGVGQQLGQYNAAVGDLGQQAGTGLNVSNQLFNLGANTVGRQADIVAMQGATNSNLAMTSGNIEGARAAARQDPFASALQAGVGAYFSDERTKYGVDEIDDDEIEAFLAGLEAKSYEYDDYAKSKGAPSGKQVGVMAQDMEKSKIGKKLVKENEDGVKMVSVPESVSALMASAAALNKRVKKLEQK